jgi:ABC-2 type transport system ATP-binding protein
MTAPDPVTVELSGVTRRFGDAIAVDGVSFAARPGEIVGLLGPNGAGKTTTMRLITGYLRPTAGTVLVGGADPAGSRAARRAIGYVPEATAVYGDMSVASYLRYWTRLRGLPRRRRAGAVATAARQAGVEPSLARRIGTLSRGLRQRVALAQALLHDPAVLVMDEPTAGLDPRQVTETRALITRLGRARTVVLSSHLLAEVSQMCQRVVVLDRGRVIADGPVGDVVGDAGTLEEAYLRLVRS